MTNPTSKRPRQRSLTDLLHDGTVPKRLRFLPTVTRLTNDPVPTFEWDIPHTIGDLAYATHHHFRYYGKFPSVVAGQVLESYPPPSKKHYVLDNFCGSGTTLVEAKLRGIRSYGVDISWLSVLVSNVKTRFVATPRILECLHDCLQYCSEEKDHRVPVDKVVEKWFWPESLPALLGLQRYLESIPISPERDFLLIAFLGIIRRVSRAFDGEVRPHINKSKKRRDVLQAFNKKVNDMVLAHEDFMSEAVEDLDANCLLADNTNLPVQFEDEHCYLVISHPPYLNSFSYAPVYKLEYYWGRPFEEEYVPADMMEAYKREMSAWPATEPLVERYYSHLRKTFEQAFSIQRESGLIALVIGDCTRQKKLEPVIDKSIKLAEEAGYALHQVNYRTTHYGLGKYAYNHRADYHGERATKKDGIIVFRK